MALVRWLAVAVALAGVAGAATVVGLWAARRGTHPSTEKQ